MKAVVAVLVIAGLGLGLAPCVKAGDSNDLEKYMRQIRSWGMTEGAHMVLFTVANMVNGFTILSFSPDSANGAWTRGYRSTACPLPGADSLAVAKLQDELAEKNERVVAALRTSADRDGSGFVTTEEASELRTLVELGYFTDYLVTKTSLGLEEMAKANSLTAQKLLDRVETYNDVAHRFNAGSAAKMPIVAVALGDKAR